LDSDFLSSDFAFPVLSALAQTLFHPNSELGMNEEFYFEVEGGNLLVGLIQNPSDFPVMWINQKLRIRPQNLFILRRPSFQGKWKGKEGDGFIIRK